MTLRAVDLEAPDHSPACPSCGDLWPPGSRYCAECGVRLLPAVVDSTAGYSVRWDAMIAVVKADREAPDSADGPAA